MNIGFWEEKGDEAERDKSQEKLDKLLGWNILEIRYVEAKRVNSQEDFLKHHMH